MTDLHIEYIVTQIQKNLYFFPIFVENVKNSDVINVLLDTLNHLKQLWKT